MWRSRGDGAWGGVFSERAGGGFLWASIFYYSVTVGDYFSSVVYYFSVEAHRRKELFGFDLTSRRVRHGLDSWRYEQRRRRPARIIGRRLWIRWRRSWHRRHPFSADHQPDNRPELHRQLSLGRRRSRCYKQPAGAVFAYGGAVCAAGLVCARRCAEDLGHDSAGADPTALSSRASGSVSRLHAVELRCGSIADRAVLLSGG